MATTGKTNFIAPVLIVSVAGVIAYFLLRKKKVNDYPMLDAPVSIVATNKNVATALKDGYVKSLNVLSASEIKKYAGWLDTANDLSKSILASSTKVTHPQIDYNVQTINNFTDNNFKSVVQNWRSIRGIKDIRDTPLMLALKNMADPTYDIVTDFYTKALELKISA